MSEVWCFAQLLTIAIPLVTLEYFGLANTLVGTLIGVLILAVYRPSNRVPTAIVRT